MSHNILSQKEIDELFGRYAEQPIVEEAAGRLTLQELNTIGEIGNICMGTAATILAELLNHDVIIGYPKTIVCRQEEIFSNFSRPYLFIEVQFISGLNGFNVLVVTEEDIAMIADIMMGGKGIVTKPVKITEMELSAATEVINQMIGAAATAMAELFGVVIDISPPVATLVEDLDNANLKPLLTDKPVVVARFETTIGDLIKTTFMQITNVDAAIEEANFLMMQAGMIDGPAEETGLQPGEPASAPAAQEMKELKELPSFATAMAVPQEMIFSLGSHRCTVEDLVRMEEGDEITLSHAPGHLEILVNGFPVACGEAGVKDKVQYVKIKKIYKPRLK